MQDEGTSKQYQQESLAFIQTINHRGIIHVGSQDDYGYQGMLTEAIAAEIKYNLSQSQYTAGIHRVNGNFMLICSREPFAEEWKAIPEVTAIGNCS